MPLTEVRPQTFAVFQQPDSASPGDLSLKEGATMTYIFDFGDWWEFNLQLETIATDDLKTDYGAIIESKGSAPPQYPDWEEEDWEDDYD